VVDLLIEGFPRILDPGFTAQMETKLDEIEEGTADWLKEMRLFYQAFARWLEQAKQKMKNVKAMEEPTDQVCEKCGRSMVIKWGRFGKFMACSGYPDCKSTKELSGNGSGDAAAGTNGQGETVGEGQPCENCGKPMVLKRGRFGPFLACSGYPECRTVIRVSQKSVPVPVNLPTRPARRAGRPWSSARAASAGSSPAAPTQVQDGEADSHRRQLPQVRGGPLRKAEQARRTFFGCTAYPKCDFTLWNRPVAEPCPPAMPPSCWRSASRPA